MKFTISKRISLAMMTFSSFAAANVIPALAGPFDDAEKASTEQFKKFDKSGTSGAAEFGGQLWAVIIIAAIIGVAAQVGLSFLKTSGNLTLQDRILQTITDSLPIIMGIVFMAAIIAWMVGTSGGKA
jgi:hypothetical protein